MVERHCDFCKYTVAAETPLRACQLITEHIAAQHAAEVAAEIRWTESDLKLLNGMRISPE